MRTPNRFRVAARKPHVDSLEGRQLLAAVPIAISNAGFESPILSNGAFTNNNMSGWLGSDPGASFNFGIFDVPTNYFPTQAPQGDNVAYIERGNISQTLATRTAVGKYVLSAKVGNSLVDPTSPYKMQLFAGSALLGETSSPQPGKGQWLEARLNVTLNAGDPRLNQPLKIQFVETLTDKSTELYVDDVKLTFEAAPAAPFAVRVGSILTVTGTGGNDFIRGSITSNVLTLRMNGLAPLTFANASTISRIVVNAGAGNDTIWMAPSVNRPTSLNGGDGNDSIYGGNAVDVINGGNGTDVAVRGAGDLVNLVEEVLA